MTRYSREAEMVLEALGNEATKQLSKENPFQNERNAKNKELCERGVKNIIIAEISGLSKQTISRIKLGTKRSGKKN